MGCSESTPIVEVDLTDHNAGDKISVSGRCRTMHKDDIPVPFTVQAKEEYVVNTDNGNTSNRYEQRKFMYPYCDLCRGMGHAVESGMVQSTKSLRQQSTFAMGLSAVCIAI